MYEKNYLQNTIYYKNKNWRNLIVLFSLSNEKEEGYQCDLGGKRRVKLEIRTL